MEGNYQNCTLAAPPGGQKIQVDPLEETWSYWEQNETETFRHIKANTW